MLKRIRIFFLVFLVFHFNSVFPFIRGGDTPATDALHQMLNRAEVLLVSNPDSAITLTKEIIDKAYQSSDIDILTKAELNAGMIYYNRNSFNRALYHFSRSLSYAQQASNPMGEAMAWNRIGNTHQLMTNYLNALEAYNRALEINRMHGIRAEEARTLVNLANAFSVIGQYQRSIELFLSALSIHEDQNEREGMAWASFGIARLFKRLNLHAKAMQYAETALDLYREIELETGNSTGVTLCLSEIGSIYHSMSDLERAKEYLHKVLVININTRNIHGQAANHLSLGIIFFEEMRYPFAQTHLTKSLELKKQVTDSIDLARLYRFLGEVELKMGNRAKGLEYLKQSLDHAQKHKLLADASESYLSLSQAYQSINRYRDALEAYAHHTAFKDSLNLTEISRLEMQYEFEKREKEQELIARQREALQQAQLERQRVVLWFFIVAFVLTGILATFIFWSYREKQRVNTLLVEQNAEITRQKAEIQSQKEEIEQQRDFVTQQRDRIAAQQKLITDSITYASRIQNAVLPSHMLSELPWESFLFFKPKSIVSGDFYWIDRLKNGKYLIALADCTGHGVPGAFMSMLGITLIREIAESDYDLTPSQMLYKLRAMVIAALNQNEGITGQSDGMDMAITLIDPHRHTMEYAGAYLPVVIVRKGDSDLDPQSKNPRLNQSNGYSLIEYRGDKMPIGQYVGDLLPFTDFSFPLKPNDTIYMFSDGYTDQFGGEQGTKFLLVNFKELLLSIQDLPLQEQKERISSTILKHQGANKQVDDMIVLGIKLPSESPQI